MTVDERLELLLKSAEALYASIREMRSSMADVLPPEREVPTSI